MTRTWFIKNGDVALDVHGKVTKIGGSQKVVQDLKNWLLNDRGYNRFSPRMGSTLDYYVGQNIDARILNNIRNEVKEVLEDYMDTQMSDLKKRIEERGEPYMAIGEAEPSSLVKTWTELTVEEKPGAIQIYISFRTFTDDIDEVIISLTTGINSMNDLG